MEGIIFAITFVLGTLRLLTWTKLFHTRFDNTIHALLGIEEVNRFVSWLQNVVYIGSLCYQTYFLYNLIIK